MASKTQTSALMKLTNTLLENLSPIERDVIALKFGILYAEEKHNNKQVAEILGVAPSTISSILSRALRKMRQPSAVRRLSTFLPDIEKAARTFDYVIKADLPYEEAKEVVREVFPQVERFAKTNSGLISILILLLAFIQAFYPIGKDIIQTQIGKEKNPTVFMQNITIVNESSSNEKVLPSAKTKVETRTEKKNKK